MSYSFTANMGRLNPANSATTMVSGLATPGWASAAGPDGRQWVTTTGGGIAAVSTSGPGSNWTIPTAGAVPIGIAQGPDGRMWFSEGTGNAIGAITMSGQITSYTLPTPDAEPQYIAAGPDGNLWFAEADGNKIGRITTSGVITEYSAGITPNSYPSIIAAGHGGVMWFSNENAASVGTITTGNPAPGPPPPPVPTPSVAPSGPTDVVTPVAQNLRSSTKDGRTTITFRLRYAATGTYSFRLETIRV